MGHIINLMALLFFIYIVSKGRKGSNKNKHYKKSQHLSNKEFPSWSKVILEDGSEFWVLNKKSYSEVAKRNVGEDLFPFTKKGLLTKAEYSFWKILKPKCDIHNLLICPKVRIEDFIHINEKDFKKRQSYRGRIKSRHIDFILCDSKLNVLAGLELDDNSHLTKKVAEVDRTKDNIFSSIQIPLYRVLMRDGFYDKQIDGILNDIVLKKGVGNEI